MTAHPHAAAATLLKIAGLLSTATLGVFSLQLAPRDGAGLVLLPLVCLVLGGVLFLTLLWRREGSLPLFEIGTMFVAAIVMYAGAPLVVHLLSNGIYTPFHAKQMFLLAPSNEQVGRFSWYYVAFLYTFAATYLAARGRARLPEPSTAPVIAGRNELRAVGIIYVAGAATLFLAFAASGANFDVAYEPDALVAAVHAYEALPLFARQLLHNLQGIVFFAKLGLLAYLMANWHRPVCRWLALGWLALLAVQYLGRMGARTEIMLTYLAVALLYHRFVKRVTLTQAALGAVALIGCFEAFSLLRGGSRAAVDAFDRSEDAIYLLGGEFQIVFAGAYHLDDMLRTGVIQHVPWQVHISEFVSLLPQQVVPVEKLDPQEWYLSHAKISAYFMMSPIAQAVAGGGMAEIALRGIMLGLVFAGVHRWYLRDPRSLPRNMFYLGMILWSYYSIRGTTFGFLYWWIYRFVPFMLLYLTLKHLPRLRAASIAPQSPDAA
jgi:hypothetical protein